MVFEAWNLPGQATLVDVGLRDGLQVIEHRLPTDEKLEILNGLIDSGFQHLEITSFAHPRVLPQFSDAVELIREAPRNQHVTYRALVPNLHGAKRAVDTNIDEIVHVVPVDAGVAMKNQRLMPDALLDELDEIVRIAHASDKKAIIAIGTAFFAPCVGPIQDEARARVLGRAVEAGVDGAYLAGTTGLETPGEFYNGITSAKATYPALDVGVHLHNRNGLGVTNAFASLTAGADWIEGSFGGLGGDLWFPGDPSILGNVPLEDVVNAFEATGIDTGIDLMRYLEVAEASTKFTEMSSYSFVSRGGTREALASASWPD